MANLKLVFVPFKQSWTTLLGTTWLENPHVFWFPTINLVDFPASYVVGNLSVSWTPRLSKVVTYWHACLTCAPCLPTKVDQKNNYLVSYLTLYNLKNFSLDNSSPLEVPSVFQPKTIQPHRDSQNPYRSPKIAWSFGKMPYRSPWTSERSTVPILEGQWVTQNVGIFRNFRGPKINGFFEVSYP